MPRGGAHFSSKELAENFQSILKGIDPSIRPDSAHDSDRQESVGLLLFIRPFTAPHHNRTSATVQKAVKRLNRRLQGQARVIVNERPGPGGEFIAKVTAEPGADLKDIAKSNAASIIAVPISLYD